MIKYDIIEPYAIRKYSYRKNELDPVELFPVWSGNNVIIEYFCVSFSNLPVCNLPFCLSKMSLNIVSLFDYIKLVYNHIKI